MNLVGKNGHINGLLAAQVLLGKDIIFFAEDEMAYDGHNHFIKGMQFNAATIYDYPDIVENIETVAQAFIECLSYVEQNDKLRCPINRIDSDIRGFLQDEDMTGMSFMHLFAWHLMIIADSGSKIAVSIDTRLREGIPDADEKVRELVRTLLRFNDVDWEEVEIDIIGMYNADV